MALDYFKAEAYTRRVLKMLEVMEEFYVLSAHRAKVREHWRNIQDKEAGLGFILKAMYTLLHVISGTRENVDKRVDASISS